MLAGEPWHPEKTLLVDYCRYGGTHQDKKVLKLLKLWGVAAKGLGQLRRAAALELQRIIMRRPFRWDDVVKAFKGARSSGFPELAAVLFHQWQSFVVRHCCISTEGVEAEDTWVYWLLETGWDDSKDKDWFRDRMGRWLERISEFPEQFKKQKELIITLTQDLTVDSAEKKNYPRFFQFVLWEHVFDPSLKNSRDAWLKKMDGHMFLPRLMESWKKNIGHLVPDPSTAQKSNYSMHASWMEVVKELNPSAFINIISRWKIDHARRKNLWAAIKEWGLLT